MAEHTGSDIRPHDEIGSNSLSRVELYHKVMHDNKKLIYEIKIGIVSLIGSIIVIACIIYIVFQCKRRSRYVYKYVRNRRQADDHKTLIDSCDSADSTEDLLSNTAKKANTTASSNTTVTVAALPSKVATTTTTKTMKTKTTIVTEIKPNKPDKLRRSLRQKCDREFYV